MIGKAKITAGVLAAVAVLAAGCGSSTTGQNTQQKPASAQSTTQPRATQPASDKRWFLGVAGTGPEAAAFDKEQQSAWDALRAHDWATAAREFRHLIGAADAYLAALRASYAEPHYQGVKEHMITAATEARNAAKDWIDGWQNSDDAKIDEAISHQRVSIKENHQALDELQFITPG